MVATVAALCVSTASAQDSKTVLTGADFLTACSRSDPQWIGFCNGYVQAVFDGIAKPWEEVCAPVGLTRSEIVEVVMKYLTDTPSLLNLNAASVVYDALVKTYPCR